MKDIFRSWRNAVKVWPLQSLKLVKGLSLRNGMKKTHWVIILLIALFGSYIWASPQITLVRIALALECECKAVLEDKVDFVAVRESLEEQMEDSSALWLLYHSSVSLSLVDKLDKFMTPSGLIRHYDRYARSKSSDSATRQFNDSMPSLRKVNYSVRSVSSSKGVDYSDDSISPPTLNCSYDSMTDFSCKLELGAGYGIKITLKMSRDGFSWKVSDVTIKIENPGLLVKDAVVDAVVDAVKVAKSMRRGMRAIRAWFLIER